MSSGLKQDFSVTNLRSGRGCGTFFSFPERSSEIAVIKVILRFLEVNDIVLSSCGNSTCLHLLFLQVYRLEDALFHSEKIRRQREGNLSISPFLPQMLSIWI